MAKPARSDLLSLPRNYHSSAAYWAHMVTFRCQGNCPYCLLDNRGEHTTPRRAEEMTAAEILGFWNGVWHKGGQRLSIIGGEPTLRADIADIVNNLDPLYEVTLTTNCAGVFHQGGDFPKRFTRPRNRFRVNTTFHPHLMTPEEYVRVVRAYAQGGHRIGQIMYVDTPETDRYRDRIEAVNREMKIQLTPYLGFWSELEHFKAPFCPETMWPREEYAATKRVGERCGIHCFAAARDACGASEPRSVVCAHPTMSFIVGPQGNVYDCHYKMFYDVEPSCNIRTGAMVPTAEPRACRHYGFCNICDIPRIGCRKGQRPQRLVLGKLHDGAEAKLPDVAYQLGLFGKAGEHAAEGPYALDLAMTLLYSGARWRGEVLDLCADAAPLLDHWLAANGYKVFCMSPKPPAGIEACGAHAVPRDVMQPYRDLACRFDLITAFDLSRFEDEAELLRLLAGYLKLGGVLSVGASFARQPREWQPGAPRLYTPATFIARVVEPLERAGGVRRIGRFDFDRDTGRATAGIAMFRRPG